MLRRPRPRLPPFAVLAAAAAACLIGTPAAAVVTISEIHYLPPPGDEELEFVELANDSATPEDISGYAFVEGIAFTIPAGTVLDGYGHVVVCAHADAVRARYGIANVLGDFTGRLDSGGERLTLVNHAGITVLSVRYRVGGKWPVAPYGTGHTLVLRKLTLDPAEPESWTQSPELGGSPGVLNFTRQGPVVSERVLVDRGALWRYQRGSAPYSAPPEAWLAPGFNDAAWLEGPSGFGYGDGDDATVLSDMQGSYTSVACRRRFTLSAEDLASEGELFFAADYDDGFCAFLNGVEVARANCNPAGGIPAAGDVATASREAGSEELYAIDRGRLQAGENVLAIAGFNLSAGSSDFSLIPRLVHRTTMDPAAVVETPLVESGETWRFVKGTAPFSTPAAAWRQRGFNDAAWLSGASGFGYQERLSGTVAYEVPAGTVGNQAYSGALGMDFDVQQAVTVTRLGVFDSGGDGLGAILTARLYNRSTRAELARLDFTSAEPGELAGGSRFKDLAVPVDLPAGFQGTIAADGYGPTELNGNQGAGPLGLVTHDGGGALSFVGGGRFGASPGTFPDTVDGGPADRYAAGTFVFGTEGAQGGGVVAPAGVATLLDDMQGRYTSIACRKSFSVAEDLLDGAVSFVLAVDFDDGFCAYVNGVEVARASCAGAAGEPAWDQTADAAREGGGELFFVVPAERFVAGENLLAVAAFNARSEDRDFKLAARLFARRSLSSTASGAVVLNELYRSSPAGSGWVELYNAAPTPADLSGFALSDGPGRLNPYRFPAGSLLAPGGFLVVDEDPAALVLSAEEVRLFLVSPQGLVAAASTFDRGPAAGLALGSYSECRHPDGGALEWVTRSPTRGAPNSVAAVEGVVINEVFYHPPEDRPGEFIELYNRSAQAVDLSGARFTDGVDYTFAEGTVLGAGAYVVIAKEPAYLLLHYGVAALGPYAGTLADRGEAVRLADRYGNPIDEVRYHDGGEWSHWADGGGSSLELIDSRQENSVASAWEASDEAAKADWVELSFSVPSYRTAAESELHLYLVERGVLRVDDVSIRRGAGANLVPNPGFEAGTAPWLIGGTHVDSHRTTEDARSGSACLEVVASGRGDTLVNRIETDTSPAMTAGPYDVSLWARWQRGGSLLVVHGEYSAGPYRTTPCFTCGVPEPNLSGNPIALALRLAVPLDLGTPGAENSATRKLREATGSSNLGPVLSRVEHRPVLPSAGEPVTVTVRVADADGVQSVRALYRTGFAGGAFSSAALLDDGLHGDGAAGDGVYAGLLPAFAASTRVVYYVEAVDALGAARISPVDAPTRTCLFAVFPPPQGRVDALHMLLDDQRTSELRTRELHSNEILEGTVLFNDEELYYHAGMRYRGSPWGRPGLTSYRVRFADDRPFHRGQDAVDLSESGQGPNEGATLFLTRRAAIPGRPSPAAEYSYIDATFNGAALGRRAMLETVDRRFLERWYGEGSEGPLLEATGRFVFHDGGALVGQNGWEGASLIHRDANPENYRGYYGQRAAQDRDEWGPLIALTRVLDPTRTPDAQFDAEVGGILDLDAFFRVLGARILITDCDAFGVNNGHNGYLAFDSLRGLWGMVPFDAECSFVNSSPNIHASADPAVARLLTRPFTRRVYHRVLSEYLDGYFSATVAAPYFLAVERATGLSTANVRGFVGGVANQVRTALGPSRSAPFRILTNSGNDVTVGTPAVTLDGEAPVTVDLILSTRDSGPPETLRPSWTTTTRWRAELSLAAERTVFDFLGFDARGGLVGSARIAVTTTFAPALAVERFSPESGPASGGTRVTFSGSGFAPGMRIRFGGSAGRDLEVQTATTVLVTTPPAPQPLPADGRIDIEVSLAASSVTLARAFTYEPADVFLRGDPNGDGKVDISDAVAVLAYLFLGGGMPGCLKSADANDTGLVDLSDAVSVLNFLFLSGRAPPPPYPRCGSDPTSDALSCEVAGTCGG
jgi:hypothetical protein